MEEVTPTKGASDATADAFAVTEDAVDTFAFIVNNVPMPDGLYERALKAVEALRTTAVPASAEATRAAVPKSVAKRIAAQKGESYPFAADAPQLQAAEAVCPNCYGTLGPRFCPGCRTPAANDRRDASDAWQPIETAPMDGTKVLAWRRGEVATAYLVPREDCEMWCFGSTTAAEHYFPGHQPTHWQPLPPPPISSAIGALPSASARRECECCGGSRVGPPNSNFAGQPCPVCKP